MAARARADGFTGRAVVLKLRTADFRRLTRSRTLPAPSQTARTLFAVAREMLAAEVGSAAYRLIGVGLAELAEVETAAADLFGGDGEARARTTETAVDALRGRFGAGAVVGGRALRRET